MKKLYCLLFVFITAGSFFAQAETVRDSSGLRFHILMSAKPVLNALSAKDSVSNFMYSHNQLEFQISYRKHRIGFGIDAGYSKNTDKINNTTRVNEKQFVSLAPNYSYRFYKAKKWSAFVGVGYFVNTIKTQSEVVSQFETVGNKVTQTEKGENLFMRVNYQFSRRISMELETALYYSSETIDSERYFSLTPAMNTTSTTERDFRTYAFPSNIWLKYSF